MPQATLLQLMQDNAMSTMLGITWGIVRLPHNRRGIRTNEVLHFGDIDKEATPINDIMP